MSIKLSRAFFCFLVCGLLARGGAVWAANGAEDLKRVEQTMDAHQAEMLDLTQKVGLTRDEIQNLREKLVESARALQEKEKQQDEIETQLASLEARAAARTDAMKGAAARLKTLTSALTRLSREPAEVFALQASPVQDHVHRALLLRALLPHLRREVESVGQELADLDALRRDVAEQKQAVAIARQSLETQRIKLDQLIQVRQGALQKTVEEREAMAAQVAALAAEAKDLRQLLDKVNRKNEKKKEKEPPPSLRTNADGALRQPVIGRVLRGFGARDETGVQSQGITYTAAVASSIVAPREGRVVFVGPFRGYGKIVILQHADGAHSFLGGFGRIDADMGQNVATGEPLGILPTKVEAGGRTSELYFEWRVKGEPQKPPFGS